jgi:hypothetical protein
MSQDQHLPLYFKFYQLIKLLYETVRSFPKQYKYSLGQSILDLGWACLDSILSAEALPKEEKHLKILQLSLAFDRLKIRLRMAQEINIVSIKQYAHLQSFYFKELGDMIGGWLKWSSQGLA